MKQIEELQNTVNILRARLATVERLRTKELAQVPIISLDIPLCSMCYTELLREYKYCPECGYKIDWRIEYGNR